MKRILWFTGLLGCLWLLYTRGLTGLYISLGVLALYYAFRLVSEFFKYRKSTRELMIQHTKACEEGDTEAAQNIMHRMMTRSWPEMSQGTREKQEPAGGQVNTGVGTRQETSRSPTFPKRDPKANKGQFNVEFRCLVEQKLNVPGHINDRALYESLLLQGDDVAKYLEPIVKKFLTTFDLSSAPPDLRPRLERSAEALVFYGLRIHCLLHRSDYRLRHNDKMNLEELYEAWLVDSLSVSQHLQGYGKYNKGIPQSLFNTVYSGEVEPIQIMIGQFSWWRRMKTRNKFLDLFESGILLALLYDIKSKEVAGEDEKRYENRRANVRDTAATQGPVTSNRPSGESHSSVREGVECQDKPKAAIRLSEEMAALQFIVAKLEQSQRDWPAIYATLKDVSNAQFKVTNEELAKFDLYLAAISFDLQAVKNCFAPQQADRIEKWVIFHIGQSKERGPYAVDVVNKYGELFQKESKIDIEFGLSAIPGRLLHRWLGEQIGTVEAETDGHETGQIDALVMSVTLTALSAFTGFWNNIKANFELVESNLPLDRKPKVFVVSDQEAVIEVAPKMLNESGYEAVGSLSLRNGEWAYGKVLHDATMFQPDVLLLCPNCHLCPIVNGQDLPGLLLERFPGAKVIITRVGEFVSVRTNITTSLQRQCRDFKLLDMPYEMSDMMALLRE